MAKKMIRPPSRRRARTRWTAVTAVVALTAAGSVACSSGSSQLGANSTCKRYLATDADTRHDAAVRLSTQLHAQDPGNPMWALDVDYQCSVNPNLTLRAALGGPSAAATDTAPAQATDTPTPTDTPTDTPTPSTSAPPADALGQIVLSSDTITNVCTANGSEQGSLSELLDGGTAVLSCDGASDQLIGLDVATGAVRWTHPLASQGDSGGSGPTTTESLLTGPGRHVYLLDLTDTPATGLAAEYYTRTLTALDARTGEQSWTQPLEPEDKQNSNGSATTTEAPGPTEGATQVLVILDEYSAFDAATGEPAWRIHTPDTDPTFVGYNLALSAAGSQTSDATDLTATNLATGRTAWIDELPAGQSTVSSGDYTAQLIGHTYWTFTDTGYDTFDVRTGKHTGHKLYPTAWTHTLVTPTYTAAYVSGTLRVFRTGDWSKPVWSVTAAETTPLVMTDQALLVQADSGTLILSMADGSILQSGVDAGNGSQDALVGGLLPTDSGILELAKP